MQRKWAELSPEEKQKERFKLWLSPQGVKFASPEAEKLYSERVTRLIDEGKLDNLCAVTEAAKEYGVYK